MSELRNKIERLLTYVEVELDAPGPDEEEFDRGYAAAFVDIKAKLEFALDE